MLRSNKGQAPEELIKIQQNPRVQNWSDLNLSEEFKMLRKLLREHMLQHEQSGYCIYCETLILHDVGSDENKNSSIEHIKPRDRFPQHVFEYDNLVVSCCSKFSCTTYKANLWDELFIHPVNEDPGAFFDYCFDTGEITPKADLNESAHAKALKTIEMLNLNELKLKNARKTTILKIRHLTDRASEDFNFYRVFPSLIAAYKESL